MVVGLTFWMFVAPSNWSYMKKEVLFEVLTFDGNATLGFVNARSEKHAQRVADRLFCISKKRERVCKCLVKKVES